MKKEGYETPFFWVELFETNDVITSSDPDGGGWTPFVPLGTGNGRFDI